MSFNINTFKSNGLVYGGARPSYFSVELSFPASISTVKGSTNLAQKSSFLIKAASLPPSTLGTIPVYHFGRPTKLAGDRTFEDWPVTVYNDEDFLLRDALESWSNSMNALIDNRMDQTVENINDASGYKQDLIVKQYGKSGPGDDSGVVRAYQLIGAFPTNVGIINLDWEDTNRIETFDVTWAYDYWVPYQIGASSPTYNGTLSNS